jgi:thiamine kinase-like enzyme
MPRATLAHNDLWLGNCLIDPRRRGDGRLVIIDWCGLCRDGTPMFDLVRLARSTALSANALRDELLAHCDIVNCKPKHVRDYLLIAIGHIGLHRNHMPMELYLSMADWTLEQLDRVSGFER